MKNQNPNPAIAEVRRRLARIFQNALADSGRRNYGTVVGDGVASLVSGDTEIERNLGTGSGRKKTDKQHSADGGTVRRIPKPARERVRRKRADGDRFDRR